MICDRVFTCHPGSKRIFNDHIRNVFLVHFSMRVLTIQENGFMGYQFIYFIPHLYDQVIVTAREVGYIKLRQHHIHHIGYFFFHHRKIRELYLFLIRFDVITHNELLILTKHSF